MNGRQVVAVLALYVVLVIGVTAVVLALTGPRRPAEDDPGWDCRTMGNHQCGPTAPPCQGDTVAAPCGSATDWTTGKGD